MIMKKLVLLLVALASLSFAADQKKEDCSRYLEYGDSLKNKGYDGSSPEMSNYNIQNAIATYLRYQICKDLEKGK
jgi:hypothetical protein